MSAAAEDDAFSPEEVRYVYYLENGLAQPVAPAPPTAASTPTPPARDTALDAPAPAPAPDAPKEVFMSMTARDDAIYSFEEERWHHYERRLLPLPPAAPAAVAPMPPPTDADPASYDALVLPGGVGNADNLRMNDDAVAFARHFGEQDKPVSVICHGAWILTDAGVLQGRTMTSFPSLQTDLRNAGVTWKDEEVVVDGRLVSSRTPDDLPAFNREMVSAIGG